MRKYHLPQDGEKRKSVWLFLFITFHSNQPAIASFSPLLKRLFNIRPGIYLFSFQFRCSLHLNFFEEHEESGAPAPFWPGSLNPVAAEAFITACAFMSVMPPNNVKTVERRHEAGPFHLNKCTQVYVCHREKWLILRVCLVPLMLLKRWVSGPSRVFFFFSSNAAVCNVGLCGRMQRRYVGRH